MYRKVNKCLSSGNKIQPDSNVPCNRSESASLKEVVDWTPPRKPAKEKNPTRAQHKASASSLETGKGKQEITCKQVTKHVKGVGYEVIDTNSN